MDSSKTQSKYLENKILFFCQIKTFIRCKYKDFKCYTVAKNNFLAEVTIKKYRHHRAHKCIVLAKHQPEIGQEHSKLILKLNVCPDITS